MSPIGVPSMAARILFIILTVFTLSAPLALAEETITLTNGEWPLYHSKEFKHGGFGTRVCTQAFAMAGYNVKYHYMPWKRGYEAAANGQFMGTVGWHKTPRGEKLFYFSDPIFSPKTVIFHTQGRSFDWKTPKDFGHLRIGGTLGYVYAEQLEEAVRLKGGHLDIAPTDEVNFLKLAAGRIDVFPCSKDVGYFIINTKLSANAARNIQHHPRLLLENAAYLLISRKVKNGQEIIKRFNESLQILKDSGYYDTYRFESLRGEYLPDQP